MEMEAAFGGKEHNKIYKASAFKDKPNELSALPDPWIRWDLKIWGVMWRSPLIRET
jgi:hypothetical protein